MPENMPFEVEQKFPLGADAALMEDRLQQLGAVRRGTQTQADRYFNHPVRDFAQTDEAVRIRSVGEENWLTYKGPKIDVRTKTRREIETALGSGVATAEQFAEVFKILGFREVATVRKQRQHFELTQAGWNFDITVDAVEGVGNFLEIELVVDASRLAAAQQAVLDLAQTLELPSPERRSYLEMLLAGGC